MYMHREKILKWRILYFSFLAKFGQNHCTIVQGLLSNFGATLKIHKNLNLIGINIAHGFFQKIAPKLPKNFITFSDTH